MVFHYKPSILEVLPLFFGNIHIALQNVLHLISISKPRQLQQTARLQLLQVLISKLHQTSKKFNGILFMEEIQRSPVEVGSFSRYLQGFIHPRWLAGCFHQQYFLPSSGWEIPNTAVRGSESNTLIHCFLLMKMQPEPMESRWLNIAWFL